MTERKVAYNTGSTSGGITCKFGANGGLSGKIKVFDTYLFLRDTKKMEEKS